MLRTHSLIDSFIPYGPHKQKLISYSIISWRSRPSFKPMVLRFRFQPFLSRQTLLYLWVLLGLFSIRQMFPRSARLPPGLPFTSFTRWMDRLHLMPTSGIRSFKRLFERQAVLSFICYLYLGLLPFCLLCCLSLSWTTFGYPNVSLNEWERTFLTIKSFSWSLLRDTGPTPLCFMALLFTLIVTVLRHAGSGRGYTSFS